MFTMNRVSPLRFYPSDRKRIVIGLISGTSADGIDAVAVEFPPVDEPQPFKILKFLSLPYPIEVRKAIMLAAADRLSLRETAKLSTQVGHLFAEAAMSVIPEGGCDLVASHGQTVCHLPESGTTMQIGEASIIARVTGVTTISDFRHADMAWGGQGAPLVPLFDAHLLSDPKRLRVAINLGGIANITVIPQAVDENPTLAESLVSAWDTGPANAVSDALCRLGGVGDFDERGELAGAGTCQGELFAELLAHDYFQKAAPKSTGLEDFGEAYALGLSSRGELKNLLRTVLCLSAQTLVNDLVAVYRNESQRRGFSGMDLVFAGGGTSNEVLMSEIRERLEQALGTDFSQTVRVMSFRDFGVPEDGREATAFAFLGDRTARGLVGAAPGATGASRAALLGKISFPIQLPF